MEQPITEAAVQTKRGKRPLLIFGVAVGVLLAAYVALCAYAVYSKPLWPNTYIMGQDVGGLTVEEADRRLEQRLPSLEVRVYLYEAGGEVPPHVPTHDGGPDAVFSAGDLGAALGERSIASSVYHMTRASFFRAGWEYVAYYLLGEVQYCADSNYLTADPALLAQTAERLTGQLSVEALDASYALGEDAILMTVAADGRQVDPAALQQQLSAGAYWFGDLILNVPYSVLSAQTLTARDIHDAVAGEVQNAGYDAAAQAITPERTGVAFDTAAAQALLDGARPGETVSVPADIAYPTVTAENLKPVLFRDVLGECRTHVSGTAARIENVKLSAAAINGAVLNSGELLSYNETTGERTAAKGYQAAPAYVQGETVDEIGGGVCQTSSTLYLACLLANLEITQRYAHRYVPAYIPWGMDATVSWGGPDYKFTNNTDYPIQVTASYAKGYLTVRILGTKTDGVTVKMTNETLSTTPSKTVYQDDPTLAPGTEEVKTSAYTGYKVRTFRNLYGPDGKLISSALEANSDYKVRDKVIVRGPAKPETPVVAPVPVPEDVPAGNPTPLPVPTPEEPLLPVEPEEPALPPEEP